MPSSTRLITLPSNEQIARSCCVFFWSVFRLPQSVLMRVGELKLNYKTGVIRLIEILTSLIGLSVLIGLKLSGSLGWFETGPY